MRKNTRDEYLLDDPNVVKTNVMGWPVLFVDRMRQPETEKINSTPEAKFVAWLANEESSGNVGDMVHDAVTRTMKAAPPEFQRQVRFLDRIASLNNEDGWPLDVLVPGVYSGSSRRLAERLRDLATTSGATEPASSSPQTAGEIRSFDYRSVLEPLKQHIPPRKASRATFVTVANSFVLKSLGEMASPGDPGPFKDFLRYNVEHRLFFDDYDQAVQAWEKRTGGGEIPADVMASLVFERVADFLKSVAKFPVPDLDFLYAQLRQCYNAAFHAFTRDVTRAYETSPVRPTGDLGVSPLWFGGQLGFQASDDSFPFGANGAQMAAALTGSRHGNSPGEEIVDEMADAIRRFVERAVYRLVVKYRIRDDDQTSESPGSFKILQKYSLPVVREVLVTLQSMGLRRMNRVPIVFAHQTWDEPSGYGTGTKAGHADDDHVMIFGTLFERTHLVHILAHEIGHVVYARLSHDEQQRVKDLASRLRMTRYGDPDYVYPGLSSPTQNHSSGNEWFAEMIAFWTLNADRLSGKVTTNNVRDLKHIDSDRIPPDPQGLGNLLAVNRDARKVFASQNPAGAVRYKKPVSGWWRSAGTKSILDVFRRNPGHVFDAAGLASSLPHIPPAAIGSALRKLAANGKLKQVAPGSGYRLSR